MRFLGPIEIATESLECIHSGPKGSADKSAKFPKLTMVPVYKMRLGIVRYDVLTSFETLGHTFPTFLPS